MSYTVDAVSLDGRGQGAVTCIAPLHARRGCMARFLVLYLTPVSRMVPPLHRIAVCVQQMLKN